MERVVPLLIAAGIFSLGSIVDINALCGSRPRRHNIQYREIRRSAEPNGLRERSAPRRESLSAEVLVARIRAADCQKLGA
jgi:hypothetical protein